MSLGLWQESEPTAGPRLTLLSPEMAKDKLNSFQIVEGEIYSSAMRENSIYLNFTRDWQSDFTIMIPKNKRIDFASAGYNLQNLQGKRVQVRGWVEDYNGPMIKINHPSQIIISDVTPSGTEAE